MIACQLVDKETGDVTVVLETPKGSRNKYRYDAECQAIRLSATLGGLAFPYDFGVFPSTLGADGDPLDVLLFLDDAVPPGSVATARLIGVLEVEQRPGRAVGAQRPVLAVATPVSIPRRRRGA